MMMITMALLVSCDGGKSDSAGTTDDSTTPDDSASDDSGTNKGDDSGTDDSGTDDSATDDSATDDSGGCPKLDWYQDVDGDGYGAGKATSACKSPGKDWTETDGDCDDALAEVNPDATEICNTIDDDCDTDVDAADSSVVLITWRTDADGDGYSDPKGKSFESCTGAGGYAPEDPTHPPDCNDGDNTVYPGAPELCDDLQQDCSTKGWSGDEGVATWYPNSGGYEDWTAEMAVGKYGKASKIDITDDGELVICDGTWYTSLNVTSALDVTITGFHGAEVTIISGGDDKRPLGVFQDGAVVTAQGLTLTEGNACYGAAVSTLNVMMCSSAGASAGWSYDISLTLSNMEIINNAPTLPAVATICAAEGLLTLDNTTVRDNTQGTMWTVDNLISCYGDTKSDAGSWGNGSGIYSLSFLKTPLLIESKGCDFDGSGGVYTPYYDVELQNLTTYDDFDFGDDANFLCDTTSLNCAK
jgi:hypothetical protein